MNKEELSALVAELLQNMDPEPAVKGSDYKPADPGPEQTGNEYAPGDFVPDISALDLRTAN